MNTFPETSRIAFESVQPIAATRKKAVWDAVFSAGLEGMTTDEVEVATGWIHQSVSALVNALRNEGALVETKRTRKTRSGRPAKVYIADMFVDPQMIGKNGNRPNAKKFVRMMKELVSNHYNLGGDFDSGRNDVVNAISRAMAECGLE